MVLMEIIDLDDSADNNSVATDNSSSTTENSPSNLNEVRQRKRKKSIEWVHSLLKKVKKTREASNTLHSSYLDPEINSCLKKNCEENSRAIKKKRIKRKRSSVVLLDSEDDCVVIDKTLCKENNNVDSDILCLSDNSVIELSDTEDVGIVAGLVETSKECINSNGRKTNNRQFENGNGISKSTLRSKKKRYHLTEDIPHRSGTILELREKSLKEIHKKKKQIQENGINEGGGTSSGSITQFRNPLTIHKQVSRQSISYQPSDSTDGIREGLRPIIIDGSNVAFGHGKERFSAKGIEICVDYFLRRKHTEIRAFVPQFRRRHPSTVGFHILDKLEEKGYLVYTPSRLVEGRRITSYDDRFIVEYAAKTGGVVITRDNYQDLLAENSSWSDTINFRLLQYTFVGDMIMFPHDPLGRGGPTLDKFLIF